MQLPAGVSSGADLTKSLDHQVVPLAVAARKEPADRHDHALLGCPVRLLERHIDWRIHHCRVQAPEFPYPAPDVLRLADHQLKIVDLTAEEPAPEASVRERVEAMSQAQHARSPQADGPLIWELAEYDAAPGPVECRQHVYHRDQKVVVGGRADSLRTHEQIPVEPQLRHPGEGTLQPAWPRVGRAEGDVLEVQSEHPCVARLIGRHRAHDLDRRVGERLPKRFRCNAQILLTATDGGAEKRRVNADSQRSSHSRLGKSQRMISASATLRPRRIRHRLRSISGRCAITEPATRTWILAREAGVASPDAETGCGCGRRCRPIARTAPFPASNPYPQKVRSMNPAGAFLRIMNSRFRSTWKVKKGDHSPLVPA